MTQAGEWSAAFTAGIGRRVAKYRTERKLSAERLAEMVTEAGAPMTRSVLANLENGRRPTVSVAELLAFAHVLGVPPIVLLMPVGQARDVEIVPDHYLPTARAVAWFTGQPYWPSDVAASPVPREWIKATQPLSRLLRHEEAVQLVETAMGTVEGPHGSVEAAVAAVTPRTMKLLAEGVTTLNRVRDEMVAEGEPLPELPDAPVFASFRQALPDVNTMRSDA